jgi:hypothetical protein
MANKIILKKSSVVAKVPVPGDLEIGEIAVNLADAKLYTKNAGGTVIQLGGGSGSGDVVGPSSATDNAVARFDSTTGKLIQNSVATIDDNGNAALNAVEFDITPAALPTAQGTLFWDNADNAQTLSLVMEGGNAIQQIGQEQYYRVKCSAAITEGQGVMLTGTVGASGGLTAGPATGLTKANAYLFMGVATESGAINDWIYITSFGIVRGINTTGGAESWVDGQILYYNPAVAGGLTDTEPAAPAAKIQVAAVIYAAANGSIFVRPRIGVQLDDLNDVESSSATTGDLLQYQATGIWQHVLPSTVTGIGSAVKLVTGRTIAVTGDLAYTSPSFDGSGNVTAAGTLATVNANVGSFTNASVTVNAKGLVTAVSSGTAPVTSVTGTAPVVSSGGATPAISLAASYGDTQNPYASKTANFVLAAPNGAAGVPTFRAVVAADIPTLNQNTTGTASNVTGTVAIINGGTGETTRQAAMDALAGAVTSGSYLRGNGTDVVMATIVAGDVPTLNQNTTGTAANVTGTVAVANGGTGATTLTLNNVLLGNGTSALQAVAPGTTGNVLTSNGTTWTSAAAAGGFAAGTRMPFAQAAAPTGWTQDTSANADNRMLRVVNTAGGGVGGTASPILNNVVPSHTHGFTTGTQSANHNHGITDPGHVHGVTIHWGSASAPGQLSGRERTPAATQNSNSNTTGISTGNNSVSHTHTGTTDNGSSQTNWTPKYIDMIICAKA